MRPRHRAQKVFLSVLPNLFPIISTLFSESMIVLIENLINLLNSSLKSATVGLLPSFDVTQFTEYIKVFMRLIIVMEFEQ